MNFVPQSAHHNYAFVTLHHQQQQPQYCYHHASNMPFYPNHPHLHTPPHTAMACPYQCQLRPVQQSFSYPIQLRSKNGTMELAPGDNHNLSANSVAQMTQLVSMPLYQNNQAHPTGLANTQPPKYGDNPHYSNQLDSMTIPNQPQLYQNQQQVDPNQNIRDESHNLMHHSTSLSKQAEQNAGYKSGRPNAQHQQCCQIPQVLQDKTDGHDDMSLDDLFMRYEKNKDNLMSFAATLRDNIDRLTQKTIVMRKETTVCCTGVDVVELI